MKLKIRTETTKDYNALANLSYAAFLYCHDNHPFVSEAPLVATTRNCSAFDPSLSLVAELNGDVNRPRHVFTFPFSGQRSGG